MRNVLSMLVLGNKPKDHEVRIILFGNRRVGKIKMFERLFGFAELMKHLKGGVRLVAKLFPITQLC